MNRTLHRHTFLWKSGMGFLAVFLIISVSNLSAEKPARPTSGIFFYFDNDFLNGTDRSYTGGFGLGWFSRDLSGDSSRGWLKWMPFVRSEGFSHHLSLSMGQRAYTPENISIQEIIPYDRPYAGIFFLSFGFHSISRNAIHMVELNTGIVGPGSGGEQMQKLIHSMTGGVDPKGWHNQLQNELVLQVFYSYRWRIAKLGQDGGLGLDLIQSADLGGGNVYTYAGLGVLARAGWNLPGDFGGVHARPGGGGEPGLWGKEGIGFNIFAGINGQTVLRNIFLDGSTWRQSHRVEKHVFTGDASLGAVIRIWRLSFRFEQVYWTKKFKTESGAHSFGKFMLAIHF